MNEGNIQTITEAGAVGIAVLLVIYNFYKDRLFSKIMESNNTTISNHLNHLNDTLIDLSEEIKAANMNHENIVSVLDKNTRVIDRVERILDSKLNN
jgi:hypothetical protein|tara:strand:- start:9987 stop:10274 length:288 start_codon:yes stop_codon:yes gene_type:complete